jgi:hypothetical protein
MISPAGGACDAARASIASSDILTLPSHFRVSARQSGREAKMSCQDTDGSNVPGDFDEVPRRWRNHVLILAATIEAGK